MAVSLSKGSTKVVTETRYEDGDVTVVQDTKYVGGQTVVKGGTEYSDTVVGNGGGHSTGGSGNLFGGGGGYDGSGLFNGAGSGGGGGGGYDGSGLFDGASPAGGGASPVAAGGAGTAPGEGPVEPSAPVPIYPRLDASSFGDVHLSTFDGIRFDCMASGHFLLLTSLEDPSFKVEGLFETKIRPGRASWTTGVAVSGIGGGTPTVQIGTPKPSDGGAESEGMFAFGGCPVNMYVDGEPASLGDDLGGSVEVYPSKSRGGSDRIVILHPATNFTVDVDLRNSKGTFGCFLDAHVSIPGDYRADETLLGLLGTRNGVQEDDWVARDGTPLPIPEDRYERLEEPAYRYCVENWGIRDEGESIFTYGPGESFVGKNKLDAEYDGLNLRDVPEELAILCGDDLA